MSTETHTVPALNERIRLSDYAINIFSSLPTKSGVKKALKKNEITINGEIASSGDWLSGGEELRLEKVIKLNLYKLSYEVVYEDDHLAVVNKPAGVPVHSHSHRNIQNSLPYNLALSSIKHALQIPRPIHRLDHETNGLLIIAKTYQAMTSLGQDLANRKIKKSYTAVTIGQMSHPSPIRDALDGKECNTFFKIIESTSSKKYEMLNLVEVNLDTGRRNQIRRHFLGIGNPILGDKKYFIEDKVSYGNGLYLMADALMFSHPITKEIINLSIPVTKKYARLFPSLIL